MGDTCTDDRFVLIEAAKKDLLESTNIDASPDEMKVLDSFIFRCWQMGWLNGYKNTQFKTINPKKKTICINFDGVIHDYSKGWQGVDVFNCAVPGAAYCTEKLKQDGHTIIIYTTRNDTPALRKFLKDNNISYDYINENPNQPKGSEKGKLIADVYIDDRAVTFNGNWFGILKKINNFKTWQDE